MRVRVAKWGNSLGVRVPKDIAAKVGLKEGAVVEIDAKDGRIVISPSRRTYALDELMVGMNPEAMRKAFDWGPDAGREAVE